MANSQKSRFKLKQWLLFATMILLLVVYLPMQVEARGKKKKGGAGGGAGSSIPCTVDCLETCCDTEIGSCKPTLLDCAKVTLRPF